MAIAVKVIKPVRLRVDSFRLYCLNEMRAAGTEIKREYEKCVSTWEHSVKFETVVSLSGGQFTVLVDTNDKIFGYVDRGTRPHPIFAGIYTGKCNKRALVFVPGGSPKTVPGVIGSGSGSKGSGKPVFTPYAQHHGTKPRNFTKNIEAMYRPRFGRHMEKAMSDWAKASGHYYGGAG